MLPSRVKGPGEYDAPLLRSSHPDRLLCNRENCITGSQKMYAGGPYVACSRALDTTVTAACSLNVNGKCSSGGTALLHGVLVLREDSP
jgi:hypothetical protein